MPASERVPPRGVLTGRGTDPGPERTPTPTPTPASPSAPAAGSRPDPGTADAVELLTRGELTVRGRLREASNAVLYCAVEHGGRQAMCVYKPVAGERPLWDFPDGTLAEREVAAYLVSEASGWDLVPPTVLREGPFGEGMCQLWIEADPEAELLALQEGEEAEPGWRAIGPAELGEGRMALLVHADDERLRRLAVLDAVINNADRKGGHLLPTADGHLYAIDHGVTFNVEDKLRTLLWGWAGEPLPQETAAVLEELGAQLGGRLGERLGALLTAAEVAATGARITGLLATGRHPQPSGRWPAVPWPPV